MYPSIYYDAFQKMKFLLKKTNETARSSHPYQITLIDAVYGLLCTTFQHDHWARAFTSTRLDKNCLSKMH